MEIKDLDINLLNPFFNLFQKVVNEEFPEYSEKVKQHFLTRDYSKESFEFNIGRDYRKMLVALENGNVAGYLIGDQTYGGVGFVSFLGVDHSHRRRGIGSSLIKKYEEFCKNEKKAHMLRLYTFERILPFYFKLGFEKIGEEKEGYWGTRNQIMAKKIGEWDERTLEA